MEVGENKSSKYWLGVLNGLKNRGVKDILFCTGFAPLFCYLCIVSQQNLKKSTL